jgi:hypothetical protein
MEVAMNLSIGPTFYFLDCALSPFLQTLPPFPGT